MSENTHSANHPASAFNEISIEVTNMGGIEAASLDVTPGVTILTGPNATNRTSLLRAIAASLGGSAGTLKRDSDNGSVSITVDNTNYTREYNRSGKIIQSQGDPYIENELLIDLFVCLLNDNQIRRRVRTGEELAEPLLAPVDTDELESKISELLTERNQIDEQLGEIEREQKRLPKLEEKRTKCQEQLEEVESDIETLREQTKTADDSANTGEAESILNSLEESQNDLEQINSEINVQRDIKDDLEVELDEVQQELSQHNVHTGELNDIKEEIDRLQGRESELSITINELSTIVEQSQKILDNENNVISEITVDDNVVNKLNPDGQSIECWTCGSQVRKGAIADRLETIEGMLQKKREDRTQIREQLSERQSQRKEIQKEQQRYEELTERRDEIEDSLERRSKLIDELTSEADTLREEIDKQQAKLKSVDGTSEDVTEDYERISKLEYERGKIEQEISDINEAINEIEYLVGKYEDLKTRRENIMDQITSLRSRVETIEKDAINIFNKHMGNVLDRLDYKNIKRVWLERQKVGGETSFELHLVRQNDSGTVYEDSIDHLSESEREVIALMAAMAGYLTHDVQETVPIILLDSLEAIDAKRIADLTKYFESHTRFLLLALLEEDAAELPDSYDRVSAPNDFIL
jgi:DNA repair exonuclease SbcCD ATPase subunit